MMTRGMCVRPNISEPCCGTTCALAGFNVANRYLIVLYYNPHKHAKVGAGFWFLLARATSAPHQGTWTFCTVRSPDDMNMF